MIWRALLLALMPMPALALSCLPYGVTDAFQDAVESSDSYVIVRGTLRFDESRLPPAAGDNDARPLTRIPAAIEGVSIGPGGQRKTFSNPVSLQVRCFGPWCAAPTAGDSLAFLRKKGRRYILETDACGGFLFDPDAALMRQVQDCIDGKPCAPGSLD